MLIKLLESIFLLITSYANTQKKILFSQPRFKLCTKITYYLSRLSFRTNFYSHQVLAESSDNLTVHPLA